jgi:hypothetical protein
MRNVARAIKGAELAGQKVTGFEIGKDGTIRVSFAESKPAEATTPFDAWKNARSA